LATTAGLRAGDADAAVESILQKLGRAIDTIEIPEATGLTDETQKMTAQVLDICRRRFEAMAQEV
jgi:hypothetical protein